MDGWIVKVDDWWLDGGYGDPGRTLVELEAKRYKTSAGAKVALEYNKRKYGKFRNFDNAEIYLSIYPKQNQGFEK